MIAWESRAFETATLLNPAFCAEVLRHAIRAYRTESGQSLPFPLAFLVLPIVLHGETRASIPARQHMHVWLQTNPQVRIGFPERAGRMVPFTKEALAFLMQVGAMTIDQSGGIMLTKHKKPPWVAQGFEVDDCYRKAVIVGRWLARSGSPATIFGMWGVAP